MKYKFENIGAVSATATMSALAATQFAWFATGVQGKLLHLALKWFYMWLASTGLVVLNIGAAHVLTLSEQAEFTGTMEDAFRLINAKGSALTDEERKAIDAKVIAAFKRFAAFGKLRDS